MPCLFLLARVFRGSLNKSATRRDLYKLWRVYLYCVYGRSAASPLLCGAGFSLRGTVAYEFALLSAHPCADLGQTRFASCEPNPTSFCMTKGSEKQAASSPLSFFISYFANSASAAASLADTQNISIAFCSSSTVGNVGAILIFLSFGSFP